MNDDQLLRYSRHIMLDEIGIEGQERILAARVLIIGAGGVAHVAAHKAAMHNELLGDICIASRTLLLPRKLNEMFETPPLTRACGRWVLIQRVASMKSTA